MLCENCKKNEATTHIKQNVNGNKSEMHLCSECAAEMGVLDNLRVPEMAMESMFSDTFFGNFLGAGIAAMNSLAGVERCDYCGSSFNDIVNTGHVGCAHCYSKFYDKLEPSLRKIHGKTKHIGKSVTYTEESDRDDKPARESKETHCEMTAVEKLQADLKKAVQEQRYEDAAVIRDKIKDITPKE